MSKFNYDLKDLEVEKDFVEKVFAFKDGKCSGLHRKKYESIICENFTQKFLSTVFIRWGRVGKKIVAIDLYCASRKCPRKFKLIAQSENISETNNVIFKVKSTHLECNHSEKVIRPLKGEERELIATQAHLKSVSVVRNEAKIKADKESLRKGNMQQIFSRGVIRKAVSEKLSKNDESSNPLFDLFLQCDKIEIVNSVEYKSKQFCVTIIADKQIEILKAYIKKCKKENRPVMLFYDATGGILQSPSENIRSLFHHVIVIPWKFNDLDNGFAIINVGELISSLHTSDQQEIFLRRFIQITSKHQINKSKNILLN